MRTLQEIQQQFPTTPEAGLSLDKVAASRQQHGSNALTPLPTEPLWKKFVEKFDEAIIKILLAAALLSMFVDLFQVNPAAAGVMLGIVAVAMIGLFVRGLQRWVPTLMFVSAIVTFFVGIWAGHPSVEGLAVMVAVILATGVAFLSEYKSDREFEILNSQKEKIRVKVLRGGDFHTVGMEEVVVGDHVVLEMGDEIPADGRLLKATDLYIDQSLMTGESEPVRKQARPAADTAEGPEQPGCLYRGTQVVDGVGLLIVTEVGDATYLGQIARRLSAEEGEDEDEGAEAVETEEKRVKKKLTISKELTPLQLKLQNLAELISKVGYIAAVAIFVALFVRGLVVGELNPTTPLAANPAETQGWLGVAGNVLNYFVYMVIIIVVAVPEGLPMSVTVSLALAMRKMTRANSLVRQLVACETIGSATVICSDKTGTLTQNKMQVVRLFWDGQVHDRGTEHWATLDKQRPWPRDGQPIDWMAINAGVNSTANLEEKEGKLTTVGNSTEGALLQWLHEAGMEYQKLRLQFSPLYQIHFSSERKRMTTVIHYDNRMVTLAKGAPEWILANSTHYQGADGTAQPWTPEARQAVEHWIRDSASQAMRTLAFAYAVLPESTPTDEDSLHGLRETIESNLVFVGFVAIRDPLRDDVKAAVDECRRAGIEVKMITGDNVETARAIAFDIGLIDRRDAPIDAEDGVILTSPKFNELYAQLKEIKQAHAEDGEANVSRREELTQRLTNLRVLARARPLDKYKMVELLQERDEVVAVTGDGTNDAPALKKADVGLAMGIAGTEVAKEASKIVLLDDAFSTIVKAVNWGRSLYENIQRFIQFQLTINVSALTIAFLGPFFGIKPPFTVLQLLWINVIMDTFAAIALCSEPPRATVMNFPPKRKDEDILSPPMKRTILTTAGFFVVVMMVFLAGMHYDLGGWGHWFAGAGDVDPQFGLTTRQVSIFFSVYVFFQVWNQINCRALTPDTSGFHNLFGNPTFLMIVGTIAVVQVLITSIPPLADIFHIEPLGMVDWVVIIAFTSTVLIFREVARHFQRPEGEDALSMTQAPAVQAA
jgi:P-type Ca2+ transporter type 2C